MNVILIRTDGGSRGNPGPAASGYVIEKDENVIASEGYPLGDTTNNVAEYTAVLRAFTWLASHRESIGDISGIDLRMDSLLVCQQLNGVYKITKPHLQEIYAQIQALMKQFQVPITIKHVYREENTKADWLVNLALDSKMTVSLQ